MTDGKRTREGPPRTVTVPAFALTRAPITVDQYRACVEAARCTPPDRGDGCNWPHPGRGDHPINCVDWQQAQVFARWVGGRLPTEAEWAYAARAGGHPQPYPWGGARPSADLAVMAEGDRESTAPVCSRTRGRTAQGLCDMAGNVWEWLGDAYGPYEEAPMDGGPRHGDGERVVRGGSWLTGADALRVTKRERRDPDAREEDLGLRVARDVR